MKKTMLVLIPLFFLGCAYSQITLDRKAIKNIRTIAVMPFTSTLKLDSTVLPEAEETFRKAFTDAGISVINKEKTDRLLLEKDFSAGITRDNITSAGRVLGADAVLTGEITIHEEENRIITTTNSGFRMFIFDELQHRHDGPKWKTYLRFRINAALVNVNDGSVILTMSNRYIETEKTEQENDPLPGYINIDAYRRLVLKKIAAELVEEIKRDN